MMKLFSLLSLLLIKLFDLMIFPLWNLNLKFQQYLFSKNKIFAQIIDQIDSQEKINFREKILKNRGWRIIKNVFANKSNSTFDINKKRNTCEKLTNNFFKSDFLVEGPMSVNCKKYRFDILKEDLQMNILQNKWDLVIMAGEINKWAQETKNNNKNELYKSSSQFQIINTKQKLLITKQNQKGDSQIIPQKVFIKKYQAMKKKNISNIEFERAKSKLNNPVHTLFVINSPKSPPSSKISQRDHQLNEVLLHVMRLRSIFCKQANMLSDAGINSN